MYIPGDLALTRNSVFVLYHTESEVILFVQFFSVACLAALQRHDECLALVNKRLNIESDNSDLLIMRSRLHQCFGNVSFTFFYFFMFVSLYNNTTALVSPRIAFVITISLKHFSLIQNIMKVKQCWPT